MIEGCNNTCEHKCSDCGKYACSEHCYYIDGLLYCLECVPVCVEEDCNNVGRNKCVDCGKQLCDEHSYAFEFGS